MLPSLMRILFFKVITSTWITKILLLFINPRILGFQGRNLKHKCSIFPIIWFGTYPWNLFIKCIHNPVECPLSSPNSTVCLCVCMDETTIFIKSDTSKFYKILVFSCHFDCHLDWTTLMPLHETLHEFLCVFQV
jgi:hypothetical protein